MTTFMGKRCPACRSTSVRLTDEPHAVEVNGRTYSAAMAVSKCANCGESTVTGNQLHLAEVEIALAMSRDLPCGQAADYMRNVANLRPGWRGITKATMVGWRRGDPVDDATWAALVAEVRQLT